MSLTGSYDTPTRVFLSSFLDERGVEGNGEGRPGSSGPLTRVLLYVLQTLLVQVETENPAIVELSVQPI